VKLLVCGGRYYRGYALLSSVLDDINHRTPITQLIHGGAVGADQLAFRWAAERNVFQRVFYAQWALIGRGAGPLRNQQMLREGKPDQVLAFPGGRGTAHMMRIAKKAGVPVQEVQTVDVEAAFARQIDADAQEMVAPELWKNLKSLEEEP
jgi:hypothetical protein